MLLFKTMEMSSDEFPTAIPRQYSQVKYYLDIAVKCTPVWPISDLIYVKPDPWKEVCFA